MEDNREQLAVSYSEGPSEGPLRKYPPPVKPKGCKVHEFMIRLLKKQGGPVRKEEAVEEEEVEVAVEEEEVAVEVAVEEEEAAVEEEEAAVEEEEAAVEVEDELEHSSVLISTTMSRWNRFKAFFNRRPK
ncbi:hypothetical protein KUCAC02_022075 [Chaenocephalus aceratus]|nr:hypothetical protein KUCAC02_022075 [Chaenocephalus aceratus]